MQRSALRAAADAEALGVITHMDEKPPIKLFSWKRAILPLAIGVAVVSYRTFESHQKKGHLDSVDVWATVVPILMLVGILAAVGWWANKRE